MSSTEIICQQHVHLLKLMCILTEPLQCSETRPCKSCGRNQVSCRRCEPKNKRMSSIPVLLTSVDIYALGTLDPKIVVWIMLIFFQTLHAARLSTLKHCEAPNVSLQETSSFLSNRWSAGIWTLFRPISRNGYPMKHRYRQQQVVSVSCLHPGLKSFSRIWYLQI